jgi:hypothetical protein
MLLGFRASLRFQERRLLTAVVLGASLAVSLGGSAQGQVSTFTRECAQKEIAALTMIEDHGAAADLASDRLGEAGLTMLRARAACYEGRVGEALTLYESILVLGPIASLNR